MFLTTFTRVVVAHDLVTILDRADPANVEADGGIEFKRIAARGRLGTEPNMTPIFIRIWLMKITMVFDRADRGSQLAHRLAHEPGLGADRELSPMSPSSSALRCQCRDGVDDHE